MRSVGTLFAMMSSTAYKGLAHQREVSLNIRELLDRQAQSLAYFFDRVETDAIESLVDLLVESAGALYISGVGKSGAIAQKLASTFVSTGHRAHYLCPTNALHGDIGIVDHRDIVLFLSKSGESEELLNLLPYLKARGVALALLTAAPKSRLALASQIVIPFPLLGELGPNEVIPTTSSAQQLILGDLIAIRVMSARGIGLDQFALNHPAGQLGRRLNLRVGDLMLTQEQLPLCNAAHRLQDALLILTRKRCGCLLIVDHFDKLQGIFTDGDLRRHLQSDGSAPLEQSMGELMNRQPKTVAPDAGAYEALKYMNQSGPITELPVISNKRLVGLLKMHDLVRHGL